MWLRPLSPTSLVVPQYADKIHQPQPLVTGLVYGKIHMKPSYGGFHKWGYPIQNPTKMDDWGVSLSRKPPYINGKNRGFNR